MRLGALGLIGIAALTASIETGSARDGCGRGLAWNGYACVPYHQPTPPIIGPNYRPGYGGGYDPRGYDPRGYAPRGYDPRSIDTRGYNRG